VIDPASLPNDIDALKALVVALVQQNEELRAQNEELRKQNAELLAQVAVIPDLTAKLDAAERELAELKRKLIGRTSERAATKGAKDAPRRKNNDAQAQKKRAAQREKRAALPTREVPHPLPEPLSEACPSCGGPAPARLEPERTVEYEWVPGYLERREHVRERAVCGCCSTFFVAPAPTRVVDAGLYGPGFISRVVVNKVLDSIPLYRQEKVFEREGLDISRSTLVDLYHRAASLIAPIYERMRKLVPQCEVVYADETSLKMQKVKKLGFIWTFATSLYILYVFSPSRAGETAKRILGDSTGLLVVDGYTGYNHVTVPERRTRAGCNAHARRKFAFIDDPGARFVLDRYAEVFAVEREADEAGIKGTSLHLEMRRNRAGPALRDIKAWCDEHAGEHGPKTPLGAAIRYMTNQWQYLTRFLDDARIAPDNNLSERLLRTIALGRKNWLFVGHEEAGKNTAMLASVLTTCVVHGVNPQDYLTDVLLRVQTHPETELDDLLPHRWKPLFGPPGPVSEAGEGGEVQ
jgi:transposase